MRIIPVVMCGGVVAWGYRHAALASFTREPTKAIYSSFTGPTADLETILPAGKRR